MLHDLSRSVVNDLLAELTRIPHAERSGIEPLTLNEADFSEARLTRIQTTRHNSPWSDNSTGTSPSPHGSNSARSAGRSPRFSVEYYREGSDEDGNDDDSTLEKRRKFKEMRKSHYQMKDAMRR